MSIIKFATVNQVSPLRRFLETLRVEPAKAVVFYGIVGFLSFLAIQGGGYALYAGHSDARAADFKGAPLQTAAVVVEDKSSWLEKNSLRTALLLKFRIAGHPMYTPTTYDARAFGVGIGDRIQVKYRVAKSGAVNIDDWQPLPR